MLEVIERDNREFIYEANIYSPEYAVIMSSLFDLCGCGVINMTYQSSIIKNKNINKKGD